MTTENYTHPALDALSELGATSGVVTSVTYRSRWLTIFQIFGRNGNQIVLINNRYCSSELLVGNCLQIVGEQRHSDYFGDLFIAKGLTDLKPTLELFPIFAPYHFFLINKQKLKDLFSGNTALLLNAITEQDINYFVYHTKISPHVAEQFIAFSRPYLTEIPSNENI